MSDEPYRKPYFDSCVFISFIKAEKLKGGQLDCRAIVDFIINESDSGRCRIYTSSLTIAEVYKHKTCSKVTDLENANLRPYFDPKNVELVDVDRAIGEAANKLCAEHQPKPDVPGLRPNDAIHLACALEAKCDVLLSWDPHLTKQKVPGIRIEEPRILGQSVLDLSLPSIAAPAARQNLKLLPPASEPNTAVIAISKKQTAEMKKVASPPAKKESQKPASKERSKAKPKKAKGPT